jgi:hypothetical protein
MNKLIQLCAVGIVAISCGPKDNGLSNDSASGVYVREFSHEVVNVNSGSKIGMAKVRDTIFVQEADNGYVVSNHKWRLNDFDQDGWVSMEHSESRPLPTFQASFDKTSSMLVAENELVSHPLYFDSENKKLYKGKSKELEYLKVK